MLMFIAILPPRAFANYAVRGAAAATAIFGSGDPLNSQIPSVGIAEIFSISLTQITLEFAVWIKINCGL
ncbi:unnamed protein product [Allacma fusca]|uniref:Uncharacterized protein n=1 Tax=Allacma fusca TaxID=39272 RepID=A0A8J2LT22_9HEXA|nr:unnamed protein product [Allacma fusca]